MIVRVGVDESVDKAFLERLPKEAQVVTVPEEPEGTLDVDFWVAALPPKILKKQWQHLQGVKVIQAPWAGVDALLNLFPREITLCDARGVHEIPTAEWTIAAILAVKKFLPFFVDMQRAGKWAVAQQIDPPRSLNFAPKHVSPLKIKSTPAPIEDLAGSTVLIVGYGSIGQAVEVRLAPFGAKFLRVARTAREHVHPVSELDQLIGKADIVVLTLPLTSETVHLIDAKKIALMKPDALLVNSSRGRLVDTDALLKALNESRIRAAIDVTDPEPLPPGHPLWKAPNLLITPHVGGDSDNFMARAFDLVAEQVKRYARGDPLLNVVTGEY